MTKITTHIWIFGIEGKKMKPTKKHRPAIWEAMLGTVYAYNGEEVKNFDYNYEAAKEFANLNGDERIYKKKRNVNYTGTRIEEPRKGKTVLWTLKKGDE